MLGYAWLSNFIKKITPRIVFLSKPVKVTATENIKQ
jgi:hypothetical protein